MLFHYINDKVPESTTRVMRKAAEARGVEFREIDAATFDFDPSRQAEPGDLLYRPAISVRAMHAEQFICTAQTASFYRHTDGPFFHGGGLWLHRHAGLPVPRFFPCYTSDRARLRENAEAVGGFPVVLKVPGNSRGIGVMRIDSLAALFSVVDFAISVGRTPMLMTFVGDAEHWRVVVIGEQAAVAYRNPMEPDDFRTYGSSKPSDFTDSVPANMAQLAVRSVHVQHLEFGGVDILRHDSGRLYLLESNFPCYHAHAEEVAGYDISGRMLDHLLAKARTLAPEARSAQRLPAALGREPGATALAQAPHLFMVDDFLSADEVQALISHIPTPDDLAQRGIAVHQGPTGLSFEWPIAGEPLLEAVAQRMTRYVGLRNELDRSLRFRHYSAGDAHPLHLDEYQMQGHHLVATALLYLSDVEASGETHFPNALPEAVKVTPKAGRLCYWYNQRGRAADPNSLHESLAVERGAKITLAQFFYGPALD